MFAYSQEQRANLRWQGHGCGNSEAEGEDLKNRGADPCHQDDREEFVAKLGASGEIDCPVSAVRFHKDNEQWKVSELIGVKSLRIEVGNLSFSREGISMP